MTEGTRIYLNSSRGKIERVLVKELGEVVLVCRKEEWDRAKGAGQEPTAVGFKRADLIQMQKAK
jgi:hypothetical protein